MQNVGHLNCDHMKLNQRITSACSRIWNSKTACSGMEGRTLHGITIDKLWTELHLIKLAGLPSHKHPRHNLTRYHSALPRDDNWIFRYEYSRRYDTVARGAWSLDCLLHTDCSNFLTCQRVLILFGKLYLPPDQTKKSVASVSLINEAHYRRWHAPLQCI